LDFQGWQESKALVLTPKFQRRGVWTNGARSFFIDTLIREMPVPPIFLRVRQSDDKKKIVREVVDGQQRLSTVLQFVNDEFRLAKSMDSRWAGRNFSELSSQYQNNIRQFSFICEIYQGVSDADILEVFARLNQYSVPLNSQELRNGKYFGFFKQSAYRLAYNYVELWRRQGLFSERAVARMQEVELTSELMIASLNGLQDKKKSIDRFYAELEESFPTQQRIESRFSATMDAIENIVGVNLKNTDFNRPPLFYSLYCAVYHRMYGLPKFSAPTPKKALTIAEGHDLANALVSLSDVLVSAREGQPFPSKFAKFVTSSRTSTDNIASRTSRLQTLYKEAF
jgi:hypothetical protein